MAKRRIQARITDELYELIERRAKVQGLSLQRIVQAAVTAYALGDLHVTASGKYTFFPPTSSLPPKVQIPDEIKGMKIIPVEALSLEGNATLYEGKIGRPQKNRRFGMGEALLHLREHTGYKITPGLLRAYLNDHPMFHKEKGDHWKWDGPGDPTLDILIEDILSGEYDKWKAKHTKKWTQVLKEEEITAAADEKLKEIQEKRTEEAIKFVEEADGSDGP